MAAKKFITRADVQRVVIQFCELNNIKLEDNLNAFEIAINAFWHGVQCGRKGNRTFQDIDIK